MNDYKIFKALYIAQATLVSSLVQGKHTINFIIILRMELESVLHYVLLLQQDGV